MLVYDKQKTLFPQNDIDWDEQHWKQLLFILIDNKIFTWKELTQLLLSNLCPPQVATRIASKKTFQSLFPKRKCWKNVKKWLQTQKGYCEDCGTRLNLQIDHIIPRQVLGDKADYLDNLTFRCRRCNIIKQPKHKNGNGGKTMLSTSAAMMWLLLTKTPSTYEQFEKLCRQYGLTCASMKFQEIWIAGKWLGLNQ